MPDAQSDFKQLLQFINKQRNENPASLFGYLSGKQNIVIGERVIYTHKLEDYQLQGLSAKDGCDIKEETVKQLVAGGTWKDAEKLANNYQLVQNALKTDPKNQDLNKAKNLLEDMAAKLIMLDAALELKHKSGTPKLSGDFFQNNLLRLNSDPITPTDPIFLFSGYRSDRTEFNKLQFAKLKKLQPLAMNEHVPSNMQKSLEEFQQFTPNGENTEYAMLPNLSIKTARAI